MCKPFLRWAGGKRRVLKQLKERLPEGRINTYYEPFLGGGAVFFSMFRDVKTAVLSDVNRDLINAWNIVRNDHEGLIQLLEKHAELHDKDRYHAVRENGLFSPVAVERAASFVYLNKVCYNGLWRVNKSGQFNVPLDQSKQAERICDPTVRHNLKAASAALTYATVVCAPYDKALEKAEAGDFVYLDPPYYSNRDKRFTTYTKKGFAPADHEKLADLVDHLDKRGVMIMMSNAAVPWVIKRYNRYDVRHILTRRSIGCNADSRKPVKELVITNY